MLIIRPYKWILCEIKVKNTYVNTYFNSFIKENTFDCLIQGLEMLF